LTVAPGTDILGSVTDPRLRSPLRAAREAAGLSQSGAARHLAALAQTRGAPVAGVVSLKTQLSRWENGHSVPEPHYQELLAELYGRSPADLGLSAPAAGSGATGLRARLAAAAAVDQGVIALWREQLTVTHRLDAELGTAGAAGPLRALVEQLQHTLVHCVTTAQRRSVAAVLAEAAVLAGEHALDAAAPEAAWTVLRTAHDAAVEAADEPSRAAAAAGLAAVLVEVDEAGAALALLAEEPRSDGAPAARLAMARGLAAAAAGDRPASERAFATARTAAARIDRFHPRLRIGVATVEGSWGHALLALGEDAEEPLRRALDTAPAPVRERAALHADLALTLAGRSPERSAEHARTAADLAARIGSERISARLRSRPRA
jgi:transcriptional regulator with XRE-family HTH domain